MFWKHQTYKEEILNRNVEGIKNSIKKKAKYQFEIMQQNHFCKLLDILIFLQFKKDFANLIIDLISILNPNFF